MAAVSSAQQLYITERERQQRSVFTTVKCLERDLSSLRRYMKVGNIPYEATEEQLREIFAAAGPILTFRLVYDRESGKPKGYGFIEYQDQATAQSAMRNLNNVDFNGRPLRVGPAAGDQNADLRALQQALGGPVPESPFGEPVDSRDAPEAISKAVASLPPEQMFELMKQMKLCIQNNPNEARNMLLQNPQLAYALLQAQIIMKIVDPQVAMALLHRDREQIPPIQPSEPEMRMLPPPPLPPQAALMGPLGMRMLEPPVQPRSLVAAGHPMLGAPMLGAPPALSAAGMPMVAMPGMPPAAIAVAGGGPSMVAGPAALRVPRPVQDPRGGLQQVLPPPPPAQIDPRMMGGVQRGPVPTTGGRLPMPAQPAPGAGASPAAASGTTVTQADQEKAALIMQVLQLSDEQIALLPPDQRTSIMILKQQIARSTGGVA